MTQFDHEEWRSQKARELLQEVNETKYGLPEPLKYWSMRVQTFLVFDAMMQLQEATQ